MVHSIFCTAFGTQECSLAQGVMNVSTLHDSHSHIGYYFKRLYCIFLMYKHICRNTHSEYYQSCSPKFFGIKMNLCKFNFFKYVYGIIRL